MNLETYRTLFTILLICTIIMLAVSVALFFILDIRKIISIKTGFAIKKSIKELEEINRNEDNKRRKKYKGHSVKLERERITQEVEQKIPQTFAAEEESAAITEKLEQTEATTVLRNFVEPDISAREQIKEKVEDTKEATNNTAEEYFKITETKMVKQSDIIINQEGEA